VLRLLRQFRVAVAWAMVPMAMWAGMRVPECQCANGEHRLFCPGALGIHLTQRVAHPAAAPASRACCQANNCSEGRGDEASCCNQPGASDSPSNSPCGHCQPVPAASATVTGSVAVPALDSAFFVAVVESGLSAFALSPMSARVEMPIETGPPLDRVIVFHCLTI